ncbi:Mu transposase C-terminal domain-containing protein [Candidatus Sumerlaeota bacterium]|nr:Mu transposase C-terminal domain-containing protein [Candidatus Sumerlaeota bacterium]
MKLLTIKDIAELRGVSVRAILKQIEKGTLRQLPPSCKAVTSFGRPPRLIDPKCLTEAEREQLGIVLQEEVAAAPKYAKLPPLAKKLDEAGIVEATDRVIFSIRGISDQARAAIRQLVRSRLSIVREFLQLAYTRNDDVMQELCNRWACGEPAILQRWNSEAKPTSRRALYRIAARVQQGDGAGLLGHIQPKHALRRSTSLSDQEERLRAILTSYAHTLPVSTYVTVLHKTVCNEANRLGLNVPSPKWTRRVVADIRRDALFMTEAHKGKKGMLLGGPYIHVDKTTILPGSQYVMDNRQFDCEVIASNGSLVRPWLTRVVDHRTGLAVGWSILESPANGDSVMATITAAMLPKVRNEYNAVAGEVLDIICGVPDLWIVDNGKDFCNKRISGFSIDQARELIGSAHGELGDARPERELVLGVLDETGARVRHAIPYNAKAKIVERTFRDISRGFDMLVPGYVGSKPEERPARTDEMRHQHQRLVKAQCTRAELAAEVGHLLIEDFSDKFEAWNWQWAAREESRAQGLQFDGRTWSPLALWGKLAASRRVPSQAMLERLSMVPEKRVVDRGVIRINRRAYWSEELLQYSGREVVVRFSRINSSSILVEQILGEGTLPAPLRIMEVQKISADASAEQIAAAMNLIRGARRAESARIRNISSEMVGSPLVEIAAQVSRHGRETGRGQIISINGQRVTPIISVRDEVIQTEGTVEADTTRDIFGLRKPKREFTSWRCEEAASADGG